MSKPAKIGLDNLVIWPMVDEEAETYSTVMAIPEIKSAVINPRASSVSDYADDMQVDEYESLEGVDFTIENRYLSTAALALIHGHIVDGKGVLDKGVDDKPPFIAIAFRSKRSDGTYQYQLLTKCKAKLSQENYKTKAEKVDPQSETTQFVCMPRKRDKKWQRKASEGDENLGADVITNWFKVPYGETVPVD